MAIAHVVHDLRPRADTLADRDATRQLAATLGVPFFEVEVRCADHAGNREAVARRLRYDALEQIARHEGFPFVAVGHHADDQLETVLMRLLRGSGPAGLAGIAPIRRLSAQSEARLLRPMMGLSRADCQSLCRDASWSWREDATNADASRVRAALRSHVVPALLKIRPDAAIRVAAAARTQRATARLIVASASAAFANVAKRSGALLWDRAPLASLAPIVLGELLRQAHRELCSRGQDRLSAAGLKPIIRALRQPGGRERTWTIAGCAFRLTRERLSISPSVPDSTKPTRQSRRR